MTCRHVLDLIDAGPWADYPPAHLEAAWRHARDCVTCGPALEASTLIARRLEGLSSTEPPAHFAASIAARIARLDTPHVVTLAAGRVRPASAAVRWWRAVAAVAGVVAASALVAWLPPDIWTTRGFGALWAGSIGVAPFIQPASSGGLLALAAGIVLLVAGLFRTTRPINSRSVSVGPRQ